MSIRPDIHFYRRSWSRQSLDDVNGVEQAATVCRGVHIWRRVVDRLLRPPARAARLHTARGALARRCPEGRTAGGGLHRQHPGRRYCHRSPEQIALFCQQHSGSCGSHFSDAHRSCSEHAQGNALVAPFRLPAKRTKVYGDTLYCTGDVTAATVLGDLAINGEAAPAPHRWSPRRLCRSSMR